MKNIQKLRNIAQTLGVDRTAFLAVSDIPFRREFRAACEQNTCGNYGKCWMCPPDIGDIDELISKAKTRKHAFIFQTIHALEDSFDIEAMQTAAKKHNDLLQALARQAQAFLSDPIKIGAGACQTCKSCAKIEGIPCRFPEHALASLECYGIAVSELAALCGLPYVNGPNTVTYWGGILFT